MAFKKLVKSSLNFLPSISRRIECSTFIISKSYYQTLVLYKMNSVYFQHEKGEETLKVTFKFQNDLINLQKPINFQRNINECIDILLNRINNKVEKILTEKLTSKKAKIKKPDLVVPEVTSEFYLNDEPLPRDVILQDLFTDKFSGNLKLKVLENEYEVLLNVPLINDITLPSVLRTETAIYPIKIEASSIVEEKCVFTWFKRKSSKEDWAKCGEGFFYISSADDFKHFLKLSCLPKNEFFEGPIIETISQSTLDKFEESKEILKRHEYTKNKSNDDEIRIVSYNILADTYTGTKEAKAVLFNYCDPSILDIDYRKDLFYAELSGYNGDIICLQEVDRKVFNNYLLPVFKTRQYFGYYNEKETVREGCATFFRNEKFKLLENSCFIYTNELMSNPLLEDFKEKIKNNSKIIERLSNLSSMLQIGVFDCLKHPDDVILVGNTHFYFHPDADHIRLLQGLIAFRLLLNKSQQMKEMYPDKQVSIMLCGDFNSTPECGFHQFLNEGSVSSNHIDWESNADEAIKDISDSHTLKMKSACGTPKYTNYTTLFKACIDYIYFQRDRLEVKQFVPIPSEESLSLQIAIPSAFYPSDHIALIADLKFKSS